MVKIVMKIHCRGVRTWGDIAPSIFLEVVKTWTISTPNISVLKEGATLKSH